VSRYKYILAVLEGEEWIETEYSYHPSAELEVLQGEKKIWKLTITRRTHEEDENATG